ncbi:hypothetical protein L1049_014010 [Liquidambar formosana]|uniref:RSE1/DDB1/CPSF1 C-terminal domain-containing protein n=1 Tax=Liquidambar formosana TaxID=63359 RepID=A0AAP0RPS4_LIQFO
MSIIGSTLRSPRELKDLRFTSMGGYWVPCQSYSIRVPTYVAGSSLPLKFLQPDKCSLHIRSERDVQLREELEDLWAAQHDRTIGRILVFSVEEKNSKLIAEKEMEGAVNSLNAFNGKLLACTNKQVQLNNWMVGDDGEFELRCECLHYGHVMGHLLQTRGNIIVVPDKMESISVLKYQDEELSIVEQARSSIAKSMSALEILGDDLYLGAETNSSLFSVRKINAYEGHVHLEVVGKYHLGESVKRFCRGSLAACFPGFEINKIPTVVFGTVNGVIGVIASLLEEHYNFSEKLQSQMREVIKDVGALTHEQWRSIQNEKKSRSSSEPIKPGEVRFDENPGSVNVRQRPINAGNKFESAKNFLDGDLIESFLHLSNPQKRRMSQEMDIIVEELCKIMSSMGDTKNPSGESATALTATSAVKFRYLIDPVDGPVPKIYEERYGNFGGMVREVWSRFDEVLEIDMDAEEKLMCYALFGLQPPKLPEMYEFPRASRLVDIPREIVQCLAVKSSLGFMMVKVMGGGDEVLNSEDDETRSSEEDESFKDSTAEKSALHRRPRRRGGRRLSRGGGWLLRAICDYGCLDFRPFDFWEPDLLVSLKPSTSKEIV